MRNIFILVGPGIVRLRDANTPRNPGLGRVVSQGLLFVAFFYRNPNGPVFGVRRTPATG